MSADTTGNGQAEFVSEWRDSAYSCFSSGHKFCRELCPVVQATGNEDFSPTAFHANVVAMEQGLVSVEDVADDYTNCTMCGACELRCPNTLDTGDFFRHRTRTVDLVKAVRALAVSSDVEQPAWKHWVEATMDKTHEPVLDGPIDPGQVAAWAADLDIPVGGETILFVDCEAAFHRTSVPRATALVLRHAGVDFGLMQEQWCCGGPAAEMGYVAHARLLAEHNVSDWRAVGARRVIALDPHDYITFTEDYPKYFGSDYDFEILYITEVIADLLDAGQLELAHPTDRVVTYHDPCRLNKRKGIWESPRRIITAVPGITFHDVNHVQQWSYCSGGGGGYAVAHPEGAAKIADRRVALARRLGVTTLLSACVWSERPLSTQASSGDTELEVLDIMELVAESIGLGPAIWAPT